MPKFQLSRQSALQIVGLIGAIACVIAFIREPSFPTPDKLIVFLTFIFMVMHQAVAMLKKMLPFVIIILIYESFRGLAHSLNSHVNYTFAPHFDKFVFGSLPTKTLQNWWWHGHVQWYDYMFYLPYMLFFAMPFALALLIWKTREKYYWWGVTAYSITFFGAFVSFLLFPAAPPWMASQQNVIEPITRISSSVWTSLGIQNFPSIYNHIAPNPVAAIPSLHAACSTLFSLLIFKLYGRRWGLVSLIYPILIYIGVVYEGEHYVFDVLTGIILASVSYWAAPWVMRQSQHVWDKLIQTVGRAR